MEMKFYQIIFILLYFIFSSNYFFSQQKLSDGVLFEIEKLKETDANWLKIQVCTEDIIRVIASPDKSFSNRPSLVVEKSEWESVSWSMQEDENWVKISTSRVTVHVSRKNGEVSFYNAEGNLILQEREQGKIITPAEVMGENIYHIQQFFNSPEDEAFYGLGQHQNNVMNYKGHDVDLTQHNMVAVVPFLVSSLPDGKAGRNYGILWDNNSQTKFGDVRDYQPLSSLIQYNSEGKKSGLTVEYFSDQEFNSLLTTQTESEIDHDFVDIPGIYPDGFNINNGSIRWSGEFEAEQTGIHKFRLYSSGYIKMWVDNKLIVDSWRQNWLPWTHFLKLPMETGKRYQFKIEWIPTGGYIGLKFLPPENGESKNTISLFSNVADQIDYYFVYGENLDEVIKGYRKITGKAPMMPKWAMGFWQCRERYRTQDELISVVEEFRNRRIPLDNIVQDWFYWEEDKWGSHEFDQERFPDPDGMVEQLHNELHTRIMISVWPKFYAGTKHYNEFKDRGWLYMHNVEKKQKDWVGPGYVSTFYDPFDDGARDLFWKQINEHLFSKGFDAWWLDATEPDLQSNVSDAERLLRVNPNAMGTSARYENAYSLMNAKGIYEGQRQTNPDQRVFILTRSAFAGQQRYSAATWGGDIAARWYDMKAQIPAGLNFSLSGIPYWTMDIGGFAVEPRYEQPNETDLEEWRELNTRWFQFGTFTPLFRAHGQFPYREMFNIAPDEHPAYQSMLAYNHLRYRLMPYIYSLAGMVTQNGYTIMRALVMDFNNDKNVFDIGDQFMFGPALLINPVTEYKARMRDVYLPEGTGWYDLKSGIYFKGGQSIEAESPYTDIPIFVKEGSIIPCGPEIQYTTEKLPDPIRLFVYTGRDGSFTLYEDENINYNYEKGSFSLIPFNYNEENKVLTIESRTGEFPGMLETRTFEVVWINKNKPSGLDFESEPDEVVTYNGTHQSVKMK
jgi:alpha-D-xyloside xylohydrolase